MNKENEIAVIANSAEYVTHCLLCGDSITTMYPNRYPKICTDCRNLWNKIKEKDNERRETD